jgi:hypothetical protein
VEYKGFECAFGERNGIGNSIHCVLSRFLGASRRGNEREREIEERTGEQRPANADHEAQALFRKFHVISGATKAFAR